MTGVVDIAGVEARSPTSAGSPGGSTGQIQYNDNGAFAGATWTYSGGDITAGGVLDMDGNDVAGVASATYTGTEFASLPTPAAGMVAHITDSSTATWGATIAGGGANAVLGWYNGTNWTVIGA